MKLFASTVSLVLLSSFMFVASASAANRYASPGTPGGDPTSCLASDPCSLVDAIDSTHTQNGDQIWLDAGTYNVSTQLLIYSDAISIHGTAAPSSTKIVSSLISDYAVFLSNSGATISGLTIESSGSSASLFAVAGKAQQLIVHNTDGVACSAGTAVFAETLCRTDGVGSSAFRMGWNNSVQTPSFSGVTAVATNPNGGYGINVVASNTAQTTFTGTSVIASGATADVRSQVQDSASVQVNLSYSNFDTIETNGGTVSGVDSPTNQSVEPKFVNPLNDFHELACSPTINAGATTADSGGTDLDGGTPRSTGGAPDIGAYEFTGAAETCGGGTTTTPPPAALPIPDSVKPILKITKKPKKKISSLKVSVSFSSNEPGSTFFCKLDKGKFKACKSPYKKSVKAGKHKLKVYAVDPAGNRSSTAEIGWLANKKK